jgi:hypothetical protein
MRSLATAKFCADVSATAHRNCLEMIDEAEFPPT